MQNMIFFSIFQVVLNFRLGLFIVKAKKYLETSFELDLFCLKKKTSWYNLICLGVFRNKEKFYVV